MEEELVDGGGDHCKAAGGYSGGAGESYNLGNVNGLSTIYSGRTDFDSKTSIGGGYYTYETTVSDDFWFGLAGSYADRLWSMAGSGGIAGQGGTVKYSETAKVYAYNGDRITNDDYTTTYYQYDKDGNVTTTVATAVTKPNGTKIIPALIFIQDGIKRAVYNYPCYMSNELLTRYGMERDTTKFEKVQLEAEQLNVKHFTQGIGSGAGYIEISNGEYEVDSSMN